MKNPPAAPIIEFPMQMEQTQSKITVIKMNTHNQRILFVKYFRAIVKKANRHFSGTCNICKDGKIIYARTKGIKNFSEHLKVCHQRLSGPTLSIAIIFFGMS